MNKTITTIKSLAGSGLITGTLLLSGLLSGCIEGAGTQLADGIGGTGITMGRLTGFGSVYVNGIHFNTDNAQFVRDGNSAGTQSDFNVGEIIRVEGTVNADRKTGTADKVIYSDVLQGSVTRVADGRTVLVMEQNVVTDQLTVFHGFKKLADLKVDNIVEVSGYTDADGKIQATSIRLLSESFTDGDILEVEGTVSQLNVAEQTFRINDLTIQYSQASLTDFSLAELRDGLYLAASTQQEISNSTMIASELIKLDDALENGVTYEVEGLVSYFLAPGYFEVDGFAVSTNESTVFENGDVSDIDENSLLIVTGVANNQGVIVADSVRLFDSADEIYLEANITAINQAKRTFTVLGQTVSVDSHTIISDDTNDSFITLDLEQFAIGQSVFVVAYKDSNDRYIASRLSRITPVTDVYLSGQAQTPDVAQGSFVLFGNTVFSDTTTLYLDNDLNELTQAAFFSHLNSGFVSVTGQQISEHHIRAESLILEVE